MKVMKKPLVIIGVFCILISGILFKEKNYSQLNPGATLRSSVYALHSNDALYPLNVPTQIIFAQGYEIIVDCYNHRLLYRGDGAQEEWKVSPLAGLDEPHAITLGADGRFYVCDTENNRVVSFSDITNPQEIKSVSVIAGQDLVRPHYILLEPTTGYLYVIDSYRRLFRMKDLGTEASYIQFSDQELNYDRGLTILDGKVHISSSSDGAVLRIDDFDKRQYTRFNSFGKLKSAGSGAWSLTGLVINHVEYFNGDYYGSNLFHKDYAQGHDPNVNRLIRWKNWDDFATGKWEDISYLIPPTLIPYYFTVHNNKLFLSTIVSSEEVKNNIYVIELGQK